MIHTSTHADLFMIVSAQGSLPSCIHVPINYVHTYIHTHIHICMHAYTPRPHPYTTFIHTYIYACIHTSTRARRFVMVSGRCFCGSSRSCRLSMFDCLLIICMHVYVRVYTCVYYMYTSYACVCVYTYMDDVSVAVLNRVA